MGTTGYLLTLLVAYYCRSKRTWDLNRIESTYDFATPSLQKPYMQHVMQKMDAVADRILIVEMYHQFRPKVM